MIGEGTVGGDHDVVRVVNDVFGQMAKHLVHQKFKEQGRIFETLRSSLVAISHTMGFRIEGG